MAFLIKDTVKNREGKEYQRFTIRFADGPRRRNIRLNQNYSLHDAEQLCGLVEDLIRNRRYDTGLSRRSAALLEALPQTFLDRLIDFGLVDRKRSLTLGALFESYYEAMRKELKQSSLTSIRQSLGKLKGFFNLDQFAERLSVEDASAFKEHLRLSGFSEATIAGHLKVAKSVFNWAVDSEYLTINPFGKISRGSFVNKSREFFVTREMYFRLLEACPDQTWRTIVTISRVGGLRTPSEVLRLTWGDVDWDKGRLLVHSGKTERHEGHGSRAIPLWPELRRELENQFEISEPGGSPFIISRYRYSEANLRTQFLRIVFRAGLLAWERPFQNMRASRSTELFGDPRLPDFVCEYWMGHSKKTAQAHYLQVTDSFYDIATSEEEETTQDAISVVSKIIRGTLNDTQTVKKD